MPVSPICTVKGSSSSDFKPLPPGVYQAELIDIEERPGDERYPEEKLSFTFAILHEGEHYGRRIWKQGTKKMNGGSKQSNLYGIMCGITGKSFTVEECEKAGEWMTPDYLNGLIGTQVRLVLIQKNKESGGVRNDVSAFLPIDALLPKFVPKERE